MQKQAEAPFTVYADFEYVDMIWNDEAEEKFESATHCHM